MLLHDDVKHTKYISSVNRYSRQHAQKFPFVIAILSCYIS